MRAHRSSIRDGVPRSQLTSRALGMYGTHQGKMQNVSPKEKLKDQSADKWNLNIERSGELRSEIATVRRIAGKESGCDLAIGVRKRTAECRHIGIRPGLRVISVVREKRKAGLGIRNPTESRRNL